MRPERSRSERGSAKRPADEERRTDGPPAPDAAADGGREAKRIDVVADASIESFPASDPPAWIGVRVGRPRR